MNRKRLQQDVADVLSTAEGLINDMIISRPADSVKHYNRMIKKFYGVQTLLLAAPELAAACGELKEAYDEGEVRGGSVDWEDVNAAHSSAVGALKAAFGKARQVQA
jgi:hypothetical protein